MTTEWSSLLALSFSLCCILALIKSDAKRHRREGNAINLPRPIRMSLAWGSLLPFALLLIAGQRSALLVWLGAVPVVGLALVLAPARRL